MPYSFADLQLDEARRELRCSGVCVAIEPKAFDLLVYLIRNRDRVVSKSELLDALWTDQDILESALSVCVHRARAALGGGASGRAMLQNVARHGYRFVANLQEDRGASSAPGIGDAFVGRTAELASIGTAIDQVIRGTMQCLLIAGEAGIGKTRLLEHASGLARGRGAEVLWADGTGAVTRGPFACWRELLAAYVAGHSISELEEALGPQRASITPLIPSLDEELTAERDGAGSRGSRREELFAAVAEFLRRLALSRPLALIFDDLYLADADSLRLLRFVVDATPRIPLLLLGSYRETEVGKEHAAADTLSALTHLPQCARIVLGPLPDAAAMALVEQLAGGAVSPAVSTAVLRRAEGNPLFVRELWRYLVNQGLVAPEPAGWTLRGDPKAVDLPAGIRDVLAKRLAQLSDGTRRLLHVAALLGRHFNGELLQRVCDESAVHDALTEAARMHIVSAAPADANAYTFLDALLFEQLTREIPHPERRALHRRIAAALEAMQGAAHDVRIMELAHHMVAGVDEATVEQASHYATLAGYQSFAQLGFHEAARWFERGVRIIERSRPEHARRRALLLLGMGDALLHAGDEAGARAAFRSAAAPSTVDRSGTRARRPTPEQPIEIDRFLSLMLVGIEIPVQRADERSLQEAIEGERAVRNSVENARVLGDAAALAAALVRWRWAASLSALPFERLQISTEAVLLAEQIDAPHLAQEARLLRIHDLLENGRMAEAEAEVATYGKIATQRNLTVYNWVAGYLRAMLHQLHGELAEAEAAAQDAWLKGGMAIGEIGPAIFVSQLLGIRGYQGRMSEMVVLLETFVRQHPEQPSGHANLASVYCELGRRDEGRGELELATQTFTSAGPFRGVLIPSVAAGIARPCLHLGAARDAAFFYEALLPWSGTYVISPLGVACLGPVDAFLGPLAECAGYWKDAMRYYEAALDSVDRIGNRPVRAHIQYEYARGLLGHGLRRHRPVAMELLTDAECVAQELNLAGLLGWIQTLKM